MVYFIGDNFGRRNGTFFFIIKIHEEEKINISRRRRNGTLCYDKFTTQIARIVTPHPYI